MKFMTLAFNWISDYWVFYLVTMTSCPSSPSSKARCKVPRSPRRVSFDFVDSERAWRCNRWGPVDMLCESSHISVPRTLAIRTYIVSWLRTLSPVTISPLLSIFMLSHWKFGNLFGAFHDSISIQSLDYFLDIPCNHLWLDIELNDKYRLQRATCRISYITIWWIFQLSSGQLGSA